MRISDADIDRIATAVVEKLTGQAQQAIDIRREVKMTCEQRKALSRERLQRARSEVVRNK